MRVAVAFILLLAAVAGLDAQWGAWPSKNVPRRSDGGVDIAAPPRRSPDGHVDLSGFWMPAEGPKLLLNLAANLTEEPPLRPWARKVLEERIATNSRDHPGARCLPSGIPEKENIPEGLKVVQTPEAMIFLYESRTIYRQIFTDGRPFPKDPLPTWMGYSIGWWEGDTFVAETRYQNGKTWLDMRGLPASEDLRVVERFTRPNVGRINIDVTIDDPKAYTKPWNVTLAWRFVPDAEPNEYICEENNKIDPRTFGRFPQ